MVSTRADPETQVEGVPPAPPRRGADAREVRTDPSDASDRPAESNMQVKISG